VSTTIHHAGWPISNGSYARGCRCDGCKAKKRAYYEQNKDEIAAKQRAYYEQNKDEIAAKKRAYREQNKDEIAAKKRAYYEQNKDEIAAKQRASKHWSKMAQRIEQFVARGISTTEIMDTLGVGYAEVKDVRDRMAS